VTSYGHIAKLVGTRKYYPSRFKWFPTLLPSPSPLLPRMDLGEEERPWFFKW
jgi:hypothetical protein